MNNLVHGYAGLKTKTDLSKWTAIRMIKDGTLPKPIQLSKRRIAWLESTLDQWLIDGGVKQ